jgi:FPC/CPF motif-containing protein YcgG
MALMSGSGVILTPNKVVHPASAVQDDWSRVAVERFSQRLLSKTSLFPCIFGSDALRRGSLRFTFVPAGGERVGYLADALGEFVEAAPGLGRRTSLVAFFQPAERLETLDDYDRYSWSLLQAVHDRDPVPWPADIPVDTENPEWEFCFAGMPMFVVVNTPAHKRRMSRYFDYLCITFQPRFVFDDIAESSAQGRNARKIIRERLNVYDALPPTPLLGSYGTQGNREWLQYFLGDDNDTTPSEKRCPFRVKGLEEEDA